MRLRRCFSLIEILMVIAIVMLMAGVISINVSRAVRQQRFHSEVATVTNALQLAEQLMLILNTDVELKFANLPKGEGISYWIELEDKLEGHWKREITRKRRPLQEVRSIEFKEASGKTISHDKLTLSFLSGGNVISQGVLKFSNSNKAGGEEVLNSYVCLPGYPYFFRAEPTADVIACNFAAQQLHQQQLTGYTIAQIREKMRQYVDVKAN